jgi:hypothetical protein
MQVASRLINNVGPESDVNSDPDPLDVQEAAETFIEAFNNLDLERFRHSFSAGAKFFSHSCCTAAKRFRRRDRSWCILAVLRM